MQEAIHRVAKTCSEFAVRIGEAESRISKLEDEAVIQGETCDLLKAQLDDTQWKLADLEDRLRQNNLRVLGVPDGVERADLCGFTVNLFKEAFPDPAQWDREEKSRGPTDSSSKLKINQ
ncbi:hypothetical protein NDU88_001957 [Pleurodeles waltl]|uniref:Uncharacterized protein n=1 Tax=Pleurodeles waltl TaxID=8319 RepID=A0AAV7LZ55_PLEWA|nr:hypothetical protein NDU88_001957 [Pleurodeles waltl]